MSFIFGLVGAGLYITFKNVNQDNHKDKIDPPTPLWNVFEDPKSLGHGKETHAVDIVPVKNGGRIGTPRYDIITPHGTRIPIYTENIEDAKRNLHFV